MYSLTQVQELEPCC